MTEFIIGVGTRFKVNPSTFNNSEIERVILHPRPHNNHDEIVAALLVTEPEFMLYEVHELSAGYIWNLGKVPNLSNEEILQYFETSMRMGRISPRRMKEAKQQVRDGMSRGNIVIQRLDSIIDRTY